MAAERAGETFPDGGGLRMAALLLLLLTVKSASGERPTASPRVFTVVNNCKATIWPAVTPGDDFSGGGFPLRPGQTAVFTAPPNWAGHIWARTGCDFDRSGSGPCRTGACGTALRCTTSGRSPASLAGFALAEVDRYDVTLVGGFNVPVVVKPVNGRGNCSAAGCDGDLLPTCPPELQLRVGGRTVGCRSACEVFGGDEFCCRGAYRDPAVCRPTNFSKPFKDACPGAYSYPSDDDPAGTFTCTGADYVVSFCSNRKQSSCTYHDNTLQCSGSDRSRRSPLCLWWRPLLLLLFFPSAAAGRLCTFHKQESLGESS